MFSQKRASKRTWSDLRVAETPVPESVDGMRRAAEAVARSGRTLFDVKALYNCVREVAEERVLVCPSPNVAGDVASLCAMARDVCSKPVAVVGHHSLPSLVRRLQAHGICIGTCDFGRRAELVDDLDEAARGWADRDVAGVIVIVVGSQDVVRPERARVVIRLTKHASKFVAKAPATYSSPRLWPINLDHVVHRGPRRDVVKGLATAWTAKPWDAEEKVPGPANPKECPICMVECANVVVSCCTAAYCWDCLQPWIEQQTCHSDSASCPSCRSELDYRTFHYVDDVAKEVITID